jgi:hypothetical protein
LAGSLARMHAACAMNEFTPSAATTCAHSSSSPAFTPVTCSPLVEQVIHANARHHRHVGFLTF